MKQIIQSFKTGKTTLEMLPAPVVKDGHVLIKTSRSLVSLGTEKMLVEFGKASIIEKARQQPEKVKMVFDKIKTDGLLPTLETVFNKLEQPLPLGYCNVGKIIGVGNGVKDFKLGDRVASNGSHAEIVSVPQNLVSHVPKNVSDDEATFTVIGSIGLQGIRLVKPTIGETVVVIGLGLIGLLTAEILIANGCKVIGYDIDDNKVKLARDKKIIAFNPLKGNDPVKFIKQQTNIGADAVVITASAKSNEIISQAAQMSRKRGRIVLIGVVGLNILRSDFYEKELSFQVSCSYGPGRYDNNYELKGIDYPLPFVRWTEKRNFDTILQLISSGKLDVKKLITEIVPLDEYQKIYGDIGKSKAIASILKYNEESVNDSTVIINNSKNKINDVVIGIIGAGNFTKMTLLPALKNINIRIKHIVSSNGLTGTELAKKYNIEQSTTDYNLVLDDEEVNLVMITTRHNLHAKMVVDSLNSNKHVFVEKPLALSIQELKLIEEASKKSKGSLVVGFNRRFSKHILKIKSLIGESQLNLIATMNAGFIPSDVWVHDLEIGGGRIVGEACHYLDLLTYLCGSEIKSVCMTALGENPQDNSDNVSILVKMKNGSNGVINYFSNGSKSYMKENLKIFYQEKTIVMENFKKTTGFGISGFSKLKTNLDKGHKSQFRLIIENLKSNGEISIISYNELMNVTRASFACIQSLKQRKWIEVS